MSCQEEWPGRAKALLPLVPRVCFPLEGTAEEPQTPKHTAQLPAALETHYKLLCYQLKRILTWFVLFIRKKPLTELSLHFVFKKKLRLKLIKKVTEFSCAQRKKPNHMHTFAVFGEISTLQSADSISKPNHSCLG